MSPPATADLFRRAVLGDAVSWEALVERFTPLLWAVARELRLDTADAADAVQTGWLRLLEQLDAIKDPEHLGGWLATTVRREGLRQIARLGRERPGGVAEMNVVEEMNVEEMNVAVPYGPPPEYRLLRAERDDFLWHAFHQLPERCRVLLRLLLTDPPLSYEDISAALGLPMGSIGPNRGRCLARLRRLVDDGGISESAGDSV
jgi:RNA polymerase sigma factor, sigma-70 family